MGTVKVTIAVGDPQGQMFEDLEVTVDTGSTFTAVPRELLSRMGVPVLRPKSACRSPANLPSTRIRARIIAPVTPSPPSAVLAPSIGGLGLKGRDR